MSPFFLALLSTGLASFGGRDQLLVAQLAGRLGPSRILLAIAWFASAFTAALAALAGMGIALLLPPAAKAMLAGFALLAGAVEMAWPWRWRRTEEPTRSAFAILIVLIAAQIGDGARFLVLAVAVATGEPVLAAFGGALGGGAALTLGWAQGAAWGKGDRLRRLRLMIAGILALAGVIIALSARGLLG